MKNWLKLLILAVLVSAASVSHGQNSLRETLRYLSDGMMNEDFELARQMHNAESEFATIYEELNYRYTDAILISRTAPFSAAFFTQNLVTIPMFQPPGIDVHALPRRLVLGLFQRAALNLPKENVIIFDLELWQQQDRRGRELLVIAEVARFSGLEGMDEEDRRYRFASLVLHFLERFSKEKSLPRTVVIKSPDEGDPTWFDGGKAFLSLSFPERDETEIVLVDSKADSVVGYLCLDPSQRREVRDPFDEFELAYLRFAHGIESRPQAVAVCQDLMRTKRDVTLRLDVSGDTHLVNDCAVVGR
jgi:hypothetical protein